MLISQPPYTRPHGSWEATYSGSQAVIVMEIAAPNSTVARWTTSSVSPNAEIAKALATCKNCINDGIVSRQDSDIDSWGIWQWEPYFNCCVYSNTYLYLLKGDLQIGMTFFPPRIGFGAKQMLLFNSESWKPLFWLHARQNTVDFTIFLIWFQVPHLPTAVTGSPTGVEFKLFHIC